MQGSPVLLLVALASQASAAPPPPRAVLQATATVRIERPSIAGSEAWERLPATSTHEVIVRDEQGRPALLRLIENQ